MSNLSVVLARESGKLIRQQAAIDATRAMIDMLENQIAVEKDDKQLEIEVGQTVKKAK